MDSFLNAILFIKKKKPDGAGLAQMGVEELAKYAAKMAMKRVMWIAIFSVGGMTMLAILGVVVVFLVLFAADWSQIASFIFDEIKILLSTFFS